MLRMKKILVNPRYMRACSLVLACTRAIEVITDLSEETFMLAFRQFAARRSLP